MMSSSGAPIDPTLPEVVRRFLEAGHTLESIRLDGSGVWWHRGNRVENRKVASLFSRSVNRTEGGTWVLEVGPFTYPIEVEATPYFVTRVRETESGQLVLSLSDGDEMALDVGALRYVESGGLSVPVRGGRFRARFLRSAYLGFVERYVVERDSGFEVVLPGGERFPLVGEDAQ